MKLVMSLILSGLIPSAVISYLTYKESSDSIRHELESKLIAIRESKSFELEKLVETMRTQVKDLAASDLVKQSFNELKFGYDQLPTDFPDLNGQKLEAGLTTFYKDKFLPNFKEHSDTPLSDSSILSSLDARGKILHDLYIENNPKADRIDYMGEDGSAYTEAHKKYHQSFVNYINNYGYYDIFFIDAQSESVIYTTFKELDLGANLKSKGFAETPLAQAYQAAVSDPSKSHISRMNHYWPSLDAPAQFVSMAIKDGDKVMGALVYQIPVKKYDLILTAEYNWKERGMGDTGENYIVGKDLKLRSMARALHSDKKSYLATLKGLNYSKEDLKFIDKHNTPALVASVKDASTESALKSDTSSVFEHKDFLGNDVITAFSKLDIPGVDWYFVSEMDVAEAMQGIYALRNMMIIVASCSMLAIAVFAIVLSSKISQKIIQIANLLKSGADRVLSSSSNIAEGSNELSATTNQLAASVQETSASVDEITAMIGRSSEAAAHASKLSQQSADMAMRGKSSVNDVRGAISLIQKSNEDVVRESEENGRQVEEINQIIQEIAEKTKVINDIVFQTKLLSFNASVEAARAGEQGKGFAVVAEEVGSLAAMSGNAANEIGTLLESSTRKVQNIVESSKEKMAKVLDEANRNVEVGMSKSVECEDILNQVLASFEQVNNSVKDIASSAKEQSVGVSEISRAVQEINSATQQNSQVAQDSSARAVELKSESDNLGDIVLDMEYIVYGAASEVRKMSTATPKVLKFKPKVTSKTIPKREQKVVGGNIPDESFFDRADEI